MKNETLLPAISEMEISGISEDMLEKAFLSVVKDRRGAIENIYRNMKEADMVAVKYFDEGYEPLEETAKKDRAALNRAEKNIAEEYAGMKAAYEKPLEDMEANIRAIRNAIKKASGIVDGAVKAYKERQDGIRNEEINAYFEKKGFDLVPLSRFFDPRWLNKTAKMKDIREEIDRTVSEIYKNIETLEKLAEHGTVAKAFYLQTLDMGAALNKAAELKANAERLAREQAEREERKARELVGANAAAERGEERATAEREKVRDLVNGALEDIGDVPQPAEAEKEPVMQYTMTFSGTEKQLLAMRRFMTDNGIPYRKGLVTDTREQAALAAKERNINGRIYSLIYVPAAGKEVA